MKEIVASVAINQYGTTLLIPIDKSCILALYPAELRRGLTASTWTTGLRRGKHIRRRRQREARERKRYEAKHHNDNLGVDDNGDMRSH